MKTSSPTTNETSHTTHTSWFRRLLGNPTPVAVTPTSESKQSQKEQKPAKQHKVLVVDDDPLFLKLTSQRLETDGYNVLLAKDGCEAIEAVRKQKPDVVVLDVDLPQDVAGVHWDGFRVIEWLSHFDSLKHIPVVMTTGGDPGKYTRLAFKAGAKGFFHKRMDQNHLVAMIKHTLGRRKLAPVGGLDTNFQI